jgi:dihydroorotate dehydrogenase electron transfer subunit
MDSVTVRSAFAEDITGIVAVERLSFPSPWDVATFESTLEDQRCLSALAIDGQMVVGYCLALNLTSMVHILNLAVHPDVRRRGIGRRLVQTILKESVANDRLCAVLEVRQFNVAARALYTSLGFSHVSTWNNYYSDTDEDAAIMVKDLRSKAVRDETSIVVSNKEVSERTFHMVLEGEIPQFDPGQFVMVQVSGTYEPFLRRPLAVFGQKNSEIELLYKIKGPGTELLSQKEAGHRIKILGPLGKGFSRRAADEVIYLAGGTGLPPLLALAERMCKGLFIFGAKTKRDVPLIERITSIPNTRSLILTEDGSFGSKGLATDALKDVLINRDRTPRTAVYSCGPERMLQEAIGITAEAGAFLEISLEERMSCGFGACAGCIVKTKSGAARVCREGPVFSADDICWS